MDFDRYTIALLIRSSKTPEVDPDQADRLQDAHMAHLASLHEGGKLVVAGPFTVGPTAPERGLCFFNCEIQEAQALCGRDPFVQAGQIEYHFFPWMTPAGSLSFARVRYPHSMSEAAG